jgi:hypothetical protein
MLSKAPELFFHDDLAPVNTPCTFTAFLSHATSKGLHYLAEAHYATMHYQHVPEPARAALAGLRLSFVQQQQYMDVLYQRWLRNSLLCRKPVARDRAPHLDTLRKCALGLRLQFTSASVDLRPGVPVRLSGAGGVNHEFSAPAEKAILAALAQSAPGRIGYAEALAGANTLLVRVFLPRIVDEEELCRFLYRLFSMDALDVLALGDGGWTRLSDSPAPSKLMRYEATQGTSITNRWHEPVGVTPEGQKWLVDWKGEASPAAVQAGFIV